MEVRLNSSSINQIINAAKSLEGQLYEDLTGNPKSQYSANQLEAVIENLMSGYIQINNIDINSTDVIRNIDDPAFIDKLIQYLKGSDALLGTRRADVLKENIDDIKLISIIRDQVEEKIKRGYATELLDNIVVRAIGDELEKHGNKKFKLNSTASFYTPHEDTRLADIQLSYIDKNNLNQMVLFDAKQKLSNFHITELKDLNERKAGFDAKTARFADDYEKLAVSILNNIKLSGFKLIDTKTTHIQRDVYDITGIYEIDDKAAANIATDLLHSKYGNVNHPLIFNSYDNIEVKTLSTVLNELLSGKANLYYPELEQYGGTYSIRIDEEQREATQDAVMADWSILSKKFNRVELWYGKK